MSERTLRRRLSEGAVVHADRDDDGTWLLPAEWLDEQFERTTIDLRDKAVAEGLAESLAKIGSLTERTIDAETAAAISEHERQSAADREQQAKDAARSLAADLDNERAERQRLEEDVVRLEKEHAVETERRTQIEAQLVDVRDSLNSLLQAQNEEIESLSETTDQQRVKLATLQALISRRKRRKFQHLINEMR